jgi:hypothetical protein
MKRIALNLAAVAALIALTLAAVAALTATNAFAEWHTIKDDVFAAGSKQDFSILMHMLSEGDREAIKEMVLEGKVGLLSKGQQVELVHVHILDGVDEVRIKGSTATSWIPSELLN